MKILIIRFSSIGDIVLTSPLVRCLKAQRNDEIHFLVKESYASVLRNNPYIDKVITYHADSLPFLKKASYDLIVDLQKSLRSEKVKFILKTKSVSYPKLNFRKWLRVNTSIDILPKSHVVDRYFESIKSLGVINDGKGLDFFIDKNAEDLGDQITSNLGNFGVLNLGGTYFTKRLPINLARKLINKSSLQLVCLGGKDTIANGAQLNSEFPVKVINMCGKTDLQVSARIIHNSRFVITGDTGLMHIAAAYQRKIFSIWGNTIPEFGMSPHYGQLNQDRNTTFQVSQLKCRPCTKLGYDRCPKGHFNCMQKINIEGLDI